VGPREPKHYPAARAFFYARAWLLVSHWAVASESTVKLITEATAELKADPKVGRAEVLRTRHIHRSERHSFSSAKVAQRSQCRPLPA
jgi:hypothetical protein